MKKLGLVVAITAAVAIAVGIFFACQKDNKEEIQKVDKFVSIQKNELGMMYFEDFDALMEIIDQIHAMDYIERAAYENANGFTSYGRQCDDIYYPSVDEESDASLQTDEEIDAFVEAYSEYVQILEDYDGELLYVPYLFDHPYRYFITKENRIFQIGENYIRIFEFGNVMTDIDNLENLRNLKEENLSSIKENNDIFFYDQKISSVENNQKAIVPSPIGYYFNEKRNASDNERSRIESYKNVVKDKRKSTYSYYIYNSIKAFKKVGKNWCAANRTIKYDLEYKYGYQAIGNNGVSLPYVRKTEYKSYTGSQKAFGYTFSNCKVNSISVRLNKGFTSYHYESISGYVSVPAAWCFF